MTWASILSAILSIGKALATLIERKQLLDAGEARLLAENLDDSLDILARALAARRAVGSDPDGLRSDKYRRD